MVWFWNLDTRLDAVAMGGGGGGGGGGGVTHIPCPMDSTSLIQEEGIIR